MGGVLIWLPGPWALGGGQSDAACTVGASLGNSMRVGIVSVSFTVA